MQSYQSGKIADQYLLQRIESASPEQLHAMLLEAGQKFLNLGVLAIANKDTPAKSRHFTRVTEIIVELTGRLNLENGGELSENLRRIYGWWIDMIFESSQKNDGERLLLILAQMGEMRASWEELHDQKSKGSHPENARASLDGLVG